MTPNDARRRTSAGSRSVAFSHGPRSPAARAATAATPPTSSPAARGLSICCTWPPSRDLEAQLPQLSVESILQFTAYGHQLVTGKKKLSHQRLQALCARFESL